MRNCTHCPSASGCRSSCVVWRAARRTRRPGGLGGPPGRSTVGRSGAATGRRSGSPTPRRDAAVAGVLGHPDHARAELVGSTRRLVSADVAPPPSVASLVAGALRPAAVKLRTAAAVLLLAGLGAGLWLHAQPPKAAPPAKP